ncbi:hypothetical protein EDM00_09585 [Ornithobacterium rhinotracheale]|uniref:hypothetical protein n=1 Tax=Ornithobacterium rhinotracheale TaxID=28251 RepID=UPI00129CFBEA|nr:hypothetical protein [Ornithobacterium rhinotracheale]MRI64239.1 hypothetical protein [Ornithobacterium rhinotracheale]
MRTKLLLFLFLPLFLQAQELYVDVATDLALANYAKNIKKGQNETNEKLTQLQKAQAFVSSQLVIVNDIQDKVYKGLKEVSGTLSNGIQIKNIYERLDRCRKYSKNIKDLIRRHPQYAIFGEAAARESYQRILQIGTNATNIITSSETNLATAGDRYKLLFEIEQDVRDLSISLIGIQLALENAERVGFWQSLNPFQGYINTDKDIVRNIMDKYKKRF